MVEQIKTWNGKNILKIKSDPLREVKFKNGEPEDDTAITVIDLSLVPAEIIHIITAVIARMTLEALQRYRKLDTKRKTLPTVLVAEEAHTFIKRYREDAENQNSPDAKSRAAD
jgi:hypothetical protein